MLKLARYILTKRKHLLENLSEMQGGCGIKPFTSDTAVKVNWYVPVVTAKYWLCTGAQVHSLPEN